MDKPYELNEPYFVNVKIRLHIEAPKYVVEVSAYDLRSRSWLAVGGSSVVNGQESARRKACALLQLIVSGDYRDGAKEEAREAKVTIQDATLPSWK